MATAYPMPDAPKVIQLLGLLFDGLDVKLGGTFEVHRRASGGTRLIWAVPL